MHAQHNDEAELRQMMAKKFKGLSEAKQARQALEAELAAVRGRMAARVDQLEAERDASAALAQASPPVSAQLALPVAHLGQLLWQSGILLHNRWTSHVQYCCNTPCPPCL